VHVPPSLYADALVPPADHVMSPTTAAVPTTNRRCRPSASNLNRRNAQTLSMSNP